MTRKQQYLKIFLYQISKISQIKTKNKGFTLTELLIAVFTAAIVISALLTAMVQILKSDQRENQRTQIQQQMQAALNYIKQDLKEAVYVYDDSQFSPSDPKTTLFELQDYLPPDFKTNNDLIPIIAFWKPQTVDISQLPSDCTTLVGKESECERLKLTQTTYTLVVYLQSTENSDIWQGQSRIERYTLPKYSNANLATLTPTQGYVDPNENNNNFFIWPFDSKGNNLQVSVPANVNSQVLVDFVDAPTNTVNTQLNCNDLSTSSVSYQETPDNSSSVQSKSFYTCVTTTTGSTGTQQNVAIYLRGSELKKNETQFADTFRPVLQTQVTIGGVIGKPIN